MPARLVVALLLVAVGAVVALLGVAALVIPDRGAARGPRLGCGGFGIGCGGFLVLLGRWLRNTALARRPELKRTLESYDPHTQRTETKKPAFLRDRAAPDEPAGDRDG